MQCRTLQLNGIHTETLGHYLSGLGLLRVVAKSNRWKGIRGYWQHDRFTLASKDSGLERESLLEYFLTYWKPSPFERWWKDAQAASKKDPAAVPRLRAIVSDDRVDQLDAVMVQANRRVFNDLFGSGGNVARREFAKVWQSCQNQAKKPKARSWLEHTLFGDEIADLPVITGAGTWFVFSNKTFNSGQSWFREGRLSPWSFLLAMEGSRLLRGAIHRRLGARAKGKVVFPFMCRPVEPQTDGQVAHGRSDFWAPLWEKAATLIEVETLLQSGLAETGGHPASAPHEFAIAAIGAGVDAGVSAFARFEFRQTTSAQVFEAIPRGQIRVRGGDSRRTRHSQLLVPLIESRWLDRLPSEPKDSKRRGGFVGLRGPIEAAIIYLSEDPDDSERWRGLLRHLATAQQRIDRNSNWRGRCVPVPRLKARWFDQAWTDPPPELLVARAIASMQASLRPADAGMQRTNPLLVNVFGVEITRSGMPVFPKARPTRAVWHEGNPTRAMIELLRRRLADANDLEPPPLYASRPCSTDIVARYLAGPSEFDDDLLARWLPALTLIHWRSKVLYSSNNSDEPAKPLPPLYSLLRPLFAPDGLRVNDRLLFPSSETDSRRPRAAAARQALNLLLQNQIDDAIAHARSRYLGVGWRTFDPPTNEISVDPERLAVALLIPANPVEVAARFREDWLMATQKQL